MKKSDGMLVSREYLERLDAAVFGTKAESAPPRRRSSSFYNFREATLTSDWTSGEGGYYHAAARFIDKSGAASGAPVRIWKRAAQKPPQTTKPLWVVNRGRWEVVENGIDGAGVTKVDVVKTITKTTGTFVTGNNAGSAQALTGLGFTEMITGVEFERNASTGLELPTEIDAVDGVLCITWEKIGLSLTKTPVSGDKDYFAKALQLTTATAATGFTTTTENVVKDI